MFDLPALDVQELSRFLGARLAANVRRVSPLGAGQWSRAFSFDTECTSFVVRLGDQKEDFEKDRIAASWRQPGLPVPRFIDMGEAFGTFYAITARAEGTFLDHLTRNEVGKVFPSLLRVLDAQRRIPVAQGAGFGLWDGTGIAEHRSWKDALLAVATERPRIAGWRRRLREWPECEHAFYQGVERLRTLAEHVPSTQHVIHSDLLNRNVLVKNAKITSVFDWGCSMYGDHLYDIAWLTFCAPYTSGFDRIEIRRWAQQHYLNEGCDRDDFDHRIGCYELHIALAALTYSAFLGDEGAARSLVTQHLAIPTHKGSAVPLGD